MGLQRLLGRPDGLMAVPQNENTWRQVGGIDMKA